MRHVDLCSGIGGFALGFEWAQLSKPVLFCDIEPWSRQILAKHWPDVPIADDVKELANDPTRIIHAIGDSPSILTAGYPCQPFSQAGQRRGSEDDRHIWPEIFSIIQQVRPDWIVCENVSGHITMGLNEVLSDLADKANYAVQAFHLGAVSVDAPHRRMRLWIVARNVDDAKSNRNKGRLSQIPRTNERAPKPKKQYENAAKQFDDAGKHTSILANADNEGIRTRIRGASSKSIKEGARRHDHNEGSRANDRFADAGKPQNLQKDVADAASARLQGAKWSEHKGNRDGLTTSSADVADAQSKRLEDDGRRGELGRERDRRRVPTQSGGEKRSNTWKPEPPVGRVANGIPRRVDRLRGLGNAIVPQIAMRIGLTIKAVNDETTNG